MKKRKKITAAVTDSQPDTILLPVSANAGNNGDPDERVGGWVGPPTQTAGPRGRPWGSGKLRNILQFEKQRYAEALTNLRLGASLTTVAALLGVKYDTFSTWLYRGRTTKRWPYRKLWGDVMNSIGEARLLAEAEIKSRDPFKWLRYSAAARLVGDEWREDPEQVSTVQVEGRLTGQTAITQEDLMSALTELRRAGIDLNALVDTGSQSLTLASRPLVLAAEQSLDDSLDDDDNPDLSGEHLGEEISPAIPVGFLAHLATSGNSNLPSAVELL